MLSKERCTEQSRQSPSPGGWHHTLHGLLAQDVRKGTVGQGRGEVLPGPINTATEHWSLQIHDRFFKHTLLVTENVQTTSFDLFPVLDTKLIHVPKVQGLGLFLNTSANPR